MVIRDVVYVVDSDKGVITGAVYVVDSDKGVIIGNNGRVAWCRGSLVPGEQ